MATDPWGYRDDYRLALEELRSDLRDESDLASPEYRLAKAKGNCIIHGLKRFGDEPLEDSTAIVAAKELVLSIANAIASLRSAEERLNRSDLGRGEQEVASHQWLEYRMEVWAVGLALDEAHIARPLPRKAMDEAVDSINDTVNRLDDALAALPWLLGSASPNLLDNWRMSIAPEFRADPPWWLRRET